MEWLRLYVDVIDDPKIQKMTPTTYQLFTFMLCLSKVEEKNGVVNLSDKEIAWRLRRPVLQVTRAISDLVDLSILVRKNNGIEFLNWSKRQYKSDDVNARVKRYRLKSETLHETLHETGQNRTDTEQNRTDTEKKQGRKNKTPLPADFKISDRVRSWAKEKGITRLDDHLEAFKLRCAAKGYAYIDHDSGFMTAIRENWGKIEGSVGNGQQKKRMLRPSDVPDADQEWGEICKRREAEGVKVKP